MGTDKALVEFRGRPLVAHALDLVRAAGLPVFIAGARSPLESFAPVVPDSKTGRWSPGRYLRRARKPQRQLTTDRGLAPEPLRVFLPVDLPLLPPSLLLYLLVPRADHGPGRDFAFGQWLPADLSGRFVSIDALPVLERELSRRPRRLLCRLPGRRRRARGACLHTSGRGAGPIPEDHASGRPPRGPLVPQCQHPGRLAPRLGHRRGSRKLIAGMLDDPLNPDPEPSDPSLIRAGNLRGAAPRRRIFRRQATLLPSPPSSFTTSPSPSTAAWFWKTSASPSIAGRRSASWAAAVWASPYPCAC